MKTSYLSALICLILFAGATPAYADDADDEPGASDNASAKGVVLGARLGWSWFTQHEMGPPLCCGERDAWTASGPQVGGTAAYEPWSWLAVGLEFGFAQYDYRGDVRDGAKRAELVDVHAGTFVDFIVVSRESFDVALGMHYAWAKLSGEIEDSQEYEGSLYEIDQTSNPLGLHMKWDWSVGAGLAMGVVASIEGYSSSETRQEFGLSLSWSP